MFKALVSISICFFSLPGSISDKTSTRKSGVLDLLEEEDSVMADSGFDIEEDLLLIGVRLNMPPLLHGNFQMSKRCLLQGVLCRYILKSNGLQKESRISHF